MKVRIFCISSLIRVAISERFIDFRLPRGGTGIAAPDETLDRLVAARLRGIPRPDRKDLKRVSDALARRGYAWDDISAALRRYADSMEDQEDLEL